MNTAHIKWAESILRRHTVARRQRSEAKMSGGGRIPDVGSDNLLTKKAPLGPIGKIGKKGFKVAKVAKTSTK